MMKLIHCADWHLDSPMGSNLSPDKARERRKELLAGFGGLVRLAAENGASGILIAGDLFDSTRSTKSTVKYVLDLIRSNPAISFFYLAGNHDKGGALTDAQDRPANLLTFGDAWTSYRFGEVTVTGSEAPDPDTLELAEGDLNIVLMHGQERAGKGAAAGDIIPLGRLKNKHIDYLALGHLHDYREAPLDRRGVACYSGCPEGRGFDECGKKGYVLLEVENKRITHRFVPFAKRELHTVLCDVTGFSSQLELEERLLAAVEGIPAHHLVKAVLTGKVPAGVSPDLSHLSATLAERFWFAKLKSEVRMELRLEDYQNDISLRGEFVRRVLASNLKDAEKERVIACGLRALAGEEVEL